MSKKVVFCIDDQKAFLSTMRTILGQAFAAAGVEAEICLFDRGEEARAAWLRRSPDGVFLDFGMPRPDGRDLLLWWKRHSELADCRVVVLSYLEDNRAEAENEGVEFWNKREPLDKHRQRIGNLINSLPRYRKPFSEHMLGLDIAPGERIKARVFGNDGRDESSNLPLAASFANDEDEIDDFFRAEEWRTKLQRRGQKLYREVFADPLEGLLWQTRTAAGKEENLRLRFSTQFTRSGAGFELLFDRPAETGGKFLSLTHPMACSILGLSPHRTFRKVNRSKLNDLAREGSRLHALFVAANLKGTLLPSLESVDDEVDTLAREVPKWFGSNGISCEATRVLSDEASIDHLRDLAGREKFDILHFAGHASNQGAGGLHVWKRVGSHREEYLASREELESLIREFEASFVYLNCCRAGKQDAPFRVYQTRLLGLANAALSGGAAASLAYRNFVRDEMAREFALSFYQALADRGELDLALLEARKAAQKRSQIDPIWLGAMLFDQTSPAT